MPYCCKTILSAFEMEHLDGLVDADTLTSIRAACHQQDKEHAKSTIIKGSVHATAVADSVAPGVGRLAPSTGSSGGASGSEGQQPPGEAGEGLDLALVKPPADQEALMLSGPSGGSSQQASRGTRQVMESSASGYRPAPHA